MIGFATERMIRVAASSPKSDEHGAEASLVIMDEATDAVSIYDYLDSSIAKDCAGMPSSWKLGVCEMTRSAIVDVAGNELVDIVEDVGFVFWRQVDKAAFDGEDDFKVVDELVVDLLFCELVRTTR